jgi:DNA-binding transcriptional LysR family regulator
MEFHSVEAIKQCAMAGLGVAFLPQIVIARELEDGRLQPLNWAGEPFHMLTQICWHKDKWLSPAMRAFLEVTRQIMH